MTLQFLLPNHTSFCVVFLKAFPCSSLGVIYLQFLEDLMAVYLFHAKNTGHYVIYFGAKTNWHSIFIEILFTALRIYHYFF